MTLSTILDLVDNCAVICHVKINGRVPAKVRCLTTDPEGIDAVVAELGDQQVERITADEGDLIIYATGAPVEKEAER